MGVLCKDHSIGLIFTALRLLYLNYPIESDNSKAKLLIIHCMRLIDRHGAELLQKVQSKLILPLLRLINAS